MFFHLNKLNEGCGKKDLLSQKNDKFCEGKNPKALNTKSKSANWQHNETRAHLNHNWENLRQ